MTLVGSGSAYVIVFAPEFPGFAIPVKELSRSPGMISSSK